MSGSAQFLSPSEAARRLGVSIKALRLYEQRGLLEPARSAAGWRAYGPEQMARGAQIAALRTLGLSLGQVARALEGDARDLEPALAAHQAALEGQIREFSSRIEKAGRLRAGLARGDAPPIDELARLPGRDAAPIIEFELPWPWGGERFELAELRQLNYIVGPLGSGKTRLAMRLADRLPDAGFLGLDRLVDGAAQAALAADPILRSRVDAALAWLIDDGATVSDALVLLLAALEAESPAILVVDMVEQGLDEDTQGALIARLRRRGAGARPLILMTRSCAILDLAAVGPDEAIIYCPANHSVPMFVAAHPGAPGYEAVATCLAPPDVRARTEGMIAWRPDAASRQTALDGNAAVASHPNISA